MEKETNYSKKLQNPRWQKKRLEIMKRDHFQCKLCKDDETELQVHHKNYINGNEPWEYENNELITLCSHCHLEIEKLKKETEIDYPDLKVYKSNNWSAGNRIMFVSYKGTCDMRIYDNNAEYIVGFRLHDYTLNDIIQILKKTKQNVQKIH
jgi:hypothetical protein